LFRLEKISKSKRIEIGIQGNYSRYNSYDSKKFRKNNKKYRLSLKNSIIEQENEKFYDKLYKTRPVVGTDS